MVSIVESSEAMVGKTLEGFITSWNLSAQSTYGCAVGDLIPLELSTTYQLCSRQSGGEISWTALNRAGQERRRPELRSHSCFSG